MVSILSTRVVVGVFLLVCILFYGCKKSHDRSEQMKDQSLSASFSNRPGPHGEKASSLDQLEKIISQLSFSDVAGKKHTIAIAMHDVQNDWSQALLSGVKETASKYDITISLITDGEFTIEKQIADIENIIRLKPDLLITLPLDAEKSLPILEKTASAGIKLVFIDAVPTNFPREKYFGWAVGDGYRMGQLSAQALEESLEKGDEVALLNWKNKMFTVDERSAGAKEYLLESKNVTIVDERFFTDFHEIPEIIDSLLDQKPNLKGLWTVWDTPAFEAIRAIKKQNRSVKVATCDLSKDAAKALAQGRYIVGLGVDQPYKQGVAVTLLALSALENIKSPTYIVLPAQKVTRATLPSSWKNIFHKNLPDEIKEQLK